MSKQYSPKRFFRKAPNKLLQQYFNNKEVLTDIDFSTLTETKVDPIYDAWLKLPEDIRNKIEQDFQEIDELATEGGTKAILDEANHHGENLAEQFSSLDGFYGHALWTFLERQQYWNGAVAFNYADNISISFWRKRKNIFCDEVKITATSIKMLEHGISSYFHPKQGRGKNCKVEHYKRNNIDYFFAYPEDYAQAIIEWENNSFKRRSQHPAFEIIFVYEKEAGTLDVFLSNDRKLAQNMQEIFANTILQTSLGDAEKDSQVYQLNPILSRDFQFIYDTESNIDNVAVKKFYLKILGTNERISLEAEPKQNRLAVYDLLDKVTKTIPLPQIVLTRVEIKAVFSSKKPNTNTFTVSYPNSCSLKQNGRDLILRKMLKESNIEPREPDNTESNSEK
ncbi:MAG: hypothetical protein KAT71_02450 [Gammaproteobacteria bacterium]|nr:hypothetical protein [Gammaproteobacteria bacterium]